MRPRRGPGIPASGLPPLAVVASEPTLRATAYVGGGGAGVRSRSPRGGRVALGKASKQTNKLEIEDGGHPWSPVSTSHHGAWRAPGNDAPATGTIIKQN